MRKVFFLVVFVLSLITVHADAVVNTFGVGTGDGSVIVERNHFLVQSNTENLWYCDGERCCTVLGIDLKNQICFASSVSSDNYGNLAAVEAKELNEDVYTLSLSSGEEIVVVEPSCSTLSCRAIDEVWLRIRGLLGFAEKVWVKGREWIDYERVYYPSVVSDDEEVVSLAVPSGKGACFSQVISTTEAEAKKNLVDVKFQNKEIRVHKIVKPLFEKINGEIDSTIQQKDGTSTMTYNFWSDTSGGTFNWRCVNSPNVHILDKITCRTATGKTARSVHSYGVAIDINPNTNPFCPAGQACNRDIPERVIAIFKNHGFAWGGDWSRGKDYMHFEWKGDCDILSSS